MHKAICLLLILPSIIGCSSLDVHPIDSSDAKGIPFYLPRQDFVIEELGFDEKGEPAEIKPRQISLVTGSDQSRAWRVVNAPHWFADSKFTVERAQNGTLKSITGESTDQIVPTVTQLAAMAAAAAAFDARTDEELRAQQQAEESLIRDLEALSHSKPPRAEQVKHIETALDLVRARIAAIKAEGKTEQSKGTKVSMRTPVVPTTMTSVESAVADSKSIPAGEVRVYLVPVQLDATRPSDPCPPAQTIQTP